MDPTTLVTFLFRAPSEARIVELLGSWDNFNRPYRMHHDTRRGRGTFSGCFKFEDIVYDGSNLQWTKPRSGGLKQGCTYWYYYRLNLDDESFNDQEPYTTACPLLPGQFLNVLDIPTEVTDLPERRNSAAGDIIGNLNGLKQWRTLDPDLKYDHLDPPPISRVHKHSVSDDALHGRLETTGVTYKKHAMCPPAGEPSSLPDSPATPHARHSSSRNYNYEIGGIISDPESNRASGSSYYEHGIDGFRSHDYDHGGQDFDSDFSEYEGSMIEEVWDPSTDVEGSDDSLLDFPYPHLAGPTPLFLTRPPRRRSEPLLRQRNSSHSSDHKWDSISTSALSVRARSSPERADAEGYEDFDPPRTFTGRSDVSNSVQISQFYESDVPTHHLHDRRNAAMGIDRPSSRRLSVMSEPILRRLHSRSSTLFPERCVRPRSHDRFYFGSPTISADTISSAGEQTPFALCIDDPFDPGALLRHTDSQAIDQVIDRLQFLGPSRPTSSIDAVSTRDEVDLERESVPALLAKERFCLDWDIKPSIPSIGLSIPSLSSTDTGTFMNDIFSELGFLGQGTA